LTINTPSVFFLLRFHANSLTAYLVPVCFLAVPSKLPSVVALVRRRLPFLDITRLTSVFSCSSLHHCTCGPCCLRLLTFSHLGTVDVS
jgi:hypothetical protein